MRHQIELAIALQHQAELRTAAHAARATRSTSPERSASKDALRVFGLRLSLAR